MYAHLRNGATSMLQHPFNIMNLIMASHVIRHIINKIR